MSLGYPNCRPQCASASYHLYLEHPRVSQSTIRVRVRAAPASADGTLDDRFLRRAFEQIKGNVGSTGPNHHHKSTVPVGTSDDLARVFTTRECVVVSNRSPRKGRAVEDFFHPTRIVIDPTIVSRRRPSPVCTRLYKPAGVFTDPVTSEFTKIAANAYLATKSRSPCHLSDRGKVGGHGEDVSRAISLDPAHRPRTSSIWPWLRGSCLPRTSPRWRRCAKRFTGFV